MDAWKQLLLLVTLVLVGGILGFALGRGCVPAPVDATVPRSAPLAADPARNGDDSELRALRREREVLLARIAELERGDGSANAVIETDVPGLRLRIAGDSGSAETGTLRVAVVDETGKPRSGLRITVNRTGGGEQPGSEGTAGPDGFATFPELPAGTYRIVVFLPQGHRRVTARLEAGEVREATVELAVGREVTGTIRHAEKGPVPGAFVSLSQMEGLTAELRFRTRSDETGAYRLECVPPGTYSLDVSTPFTSGLRGGTRTELVVAAGGPTRKDVVVGVPKLHGTVRDAVTGLPIPHVTVRIQMPYHEAVSDAEGRYRFADLEPRTYRSIVVSRDGYGLVFLRDVEVKEEGSELDLELTPAATVHLRIRGVVGQPVVGRVHFGISPVVRGKGTSVGTSVTADHEGRATYRKIVPGDYTLRLSAGEAKAELKVRVAPGENTFEATLE
jgi:hypothetical protein